MQRWCWRKDPVFCSDKPPWQVKGFCEAKIESHWQNIFIKWDRLFLYDIYLLFYLVPFIQTRNQFSPDFWDKICELKIWVMRVVVNFCINSQNCKKKVQASFLWKNVNQILFNSWQMTFFRGGLKGVGRCIDSKSHKMVALLSNYLTTIKILKQFQDFIHENQLYK